MFLDDKLYLHVKNRQIDTSEDFAQMIHELYKICEDHYKPTLSASDTYKDVINTMDRVFNSWNLFVKKLEKEKYPFADIFLLPGISYKDVFLANEKM